MDDVLGTGGPAGHGRLARLLALAVAVLVGAAGATYALWHGRSAYPAGVVVTGDLALSGGAFRWVETTAAVPEADRQSGDDLASLAGFTGMPGDEVELHFAVDVLADGANLKAALRAGLADSAEAPQGVELPGYRVLASDSTVLFPADGLVPLGQDVGLDELDAGPAANLVITVVVSWPGSAADVAYTDVLVGSDVDLSALPIELSLTQVR